jgi:GH15 family glucan-1,4-alpha-glucosidase
VGVGGDRVSARADRTLPSGAWRARHDRAIKPVERGGVEGAVERWRRLATSIHDEVCCSGFDAERGAFVQYCGSKELDAALLLMPLVGFLPVDDPRVAGTIRAIERELMVEGLVLRYRCREHVEASQPGEGAFLACSFWLADVPAMAGRRADALAQFERLLALR